MDHLCLNDKSVCIKYLMIMVVSAKFQIDIGEFYKKLRTHYWCVRSFSYSASADNASPESGIRTARLKMVISDAYISQVPYYSIRLDAAHKEHDQS